MRAWIVDAPDAPFREIELPIPEPRAGEVLVRVEASGVNPLDTKIRAGSAAHARHPLPAVLGIDLAAVDLIGASHVRHRHPRRPRPAGAALGPGCGERRVPAGAAVPPGPARSRLRRRAACAAPAGDPRRRPPRRLVRIISENYFEDAGYQRAMLGRIAAEVPIVMHGVSLSIGSDAPLDTAYLGQLRRLMEELRAAWVSDHLCWTGLGSHNSHD
ncbi:DUF692 family protein, partial [Burkholderia gladioli]|nr:DUF692 family protein [Burkholderia gladioli]